jgi:hypothetical protein
LAIGAVVTLAVAAGIIAAAPSSSESPTKETKCEAWMRTDMTARLHGQVEPPPSKACTGLTDAQWMSIGGHLEPLHTALTEAQR